MTSSTNKAKDLGHNLTIHPAFGHRSAVSSKLKLYECKNSHTFMWLNKQVKD